MRSSTTLALLFTLSAASLLAVSSASANAVPPRTQSSYGDAGSAIESTGSFTTVAGLLNAQGFCADSDTDSVGGTCAYSFAYQFPNALPPGTTSLTITLPVPVNTSLSTDFSAIGMGILTNDDGSGVTSPDLFYTPHLSQDTFGPGPVFLTSLSSSAITFGLNGSGNPYITFNDPLTNLPDDGKGLSVFLDLSDNNSVNGDGLFCYKVTDVCTSTDLPSIPTPDVTITSSVSTAPEPGTLLSLFPALGLLALYRRRAKS